MSQRSKTKKQKNKTKQKGKAYEVEKILLHETKGGKKYFLVQWKGYSITESTWEPEDNLDGCKDLIDAYFMNNSANHEKLETEIPDIEILSVAGKENGKLIYNARNNTTKQLFLIHPQDREPYLLKILDFLHDNLEFIN